MGMAASQARFLSLTARKSNTEYEGQQINQERTALANESSNLYSRLSKMDVPTPPDTSDFYKTQYTFSSNKISSANGYITYSLDNIKDTPDGTVATVSHSVNVYQNKAEFITGSIKDDTLSDYAPGTVTDYDSTDSPNYSDAYNVNGGILSGKLFNSGDNTYAVYLEEVSENQSSLDALNGDNVNSKDYISSYDFDGDGVPTNYLSYSMINGKKYYFTNSQLTKIQNQRPDGSIEEKYETIGALSSIYTASKTITEEIPITRYEENDTGRTTSITIEVDGDEYTYELECVSVQDEDAYAQAMLDYEYEQARYEKNVSNINSKTEEIQAKDKTLELELKQLDTEQNAIATEMDAVQKVVEDNVESTFKTFA